MTATAAAPSMKVSPGRKPLGERLVTLMTTTDHKLIGKMYLLTAFAWFVIAGIMAMIIRAELAFPGSQIVARS